MLDGLNHGFGKKTRNTAVKAQGGREDGGGTIRKQGLNMWSSQNTTHGILAVCLAFH